jgi:hypothetical protein
MNHPANFKVSDVHIREDQDREKKFPHHCVHVGPLQAYALPTFEEKTRWMLEFHDFARLAVHSRSEWFPGFAWGELSATQS